MSSRRTPGALLVLLLLVSLALVSCGGDGNDGGDDGATSADAESPAADATSEPASDEGTTGSAAGGAGTGQGSFTADGQTYDFTADQFCTIFPDPEEGFAAVNGTTADGAPVRISVREDDENIDSVQVGEESGDDLFFLAQSGEQTAGSIDSFTIEEGAVSGTTQAVAGLGGGGLGNTVELTFEATCDG